MKAETGRPLTRVVVSMMLTLTVFLDGGMFKVGGEVGEAMKMNILLDSPMVDIAVVWMYHEGNEGTTYML